MPFRGKRAYREEKVRNVVRDVHGQTNVREMEAVAEEDEGKRDDMVSNKLLKVLPRLLQLQHQHDTLLRPVTRLQQVIRLELGRVHAVRKVDKHGVRVEVPNVGPAHDPQAVRPEDGKVHGRVHLLHEPRDLCFSANPAVQRPRPDHALHQKLARETQHDHVESYKRKVELALAVDDWIIGRLSGDRVREEEGMVQRVRLGRVDGVRGEQHGEEDQRDEPGVFEAEVFEAAEGRAAALRSVLLRALSRSAQFNEKEFLLPTLSAAPATADAELIVTRLGQWSK